MLLDKEVRILSLNVPQATNSHKQASLRDLPEFVSGGFPFGWYAAKACRQKKGNRTEIGKSYPWAIPPWGTREIVSFAILQQLKVKLQERLVEMGTLVREHRDSGSDPEGVGWRSY